MVVIGVIGDVRVAVNVALGVDVSVECGLKRIWS